MLKSFYNHYITIPALYTYDFKLLFKYWPKQDRWKSNNLWLSGRGMFHVIDLEETWKP